MLREEMGLMGVLCVLLVVLFVPAAQGQDGYPPQDALYGNWTVSSSRVRAIFETPGLLKEKKLETWTISASAGNVVKIVGFSGGPNSTIYATYEYGLLFLGFSDDAVPYAHTGYAQIKGKPGKLSFTGETIAVGAGTWGELRADTMKGKKTSASGSPAPGAAPAAADAGEPDPVVAGKVPPTPPPAAALVDTYWIVKISGKGYDFTKNEPMSVAHTEYWHFAAGGDPNEFVVATSDGEGEEDTIELEYFNGILIMADANGLDPATQSSVAYLQVTGNPGAMMKLTGAYIGYDIVIDSNDDEIESSKVSGKQVPPFPL